MHGRLNLIWEQAQQLGVAVQPGLEPGSTVYMTDALPTELLTTPAEMSD